MCAHSPPTPAIHSEQRKAGWKVLGNFYHIDDDFRLPLCPVSQTWISCGTPLAKGESSVFLQWQSCKPWFAQADCEPLQLQKSVLESVLLGESLELRCQRWWFLCTSLLVIISPSVASHGVGDFIQTQQLDLICQPANKNSVGWRKVQASSLSALLSSNTGTAQLLRMGLRCQRGTLTASRCGDH